MFSATSCALSSGCLISWIEMRTRLPKRFSRSSRSWSTDAPPLPITMPGLAVWIVTVSCPLEARQDDPAHLQVLVEHLCVVLGVGEPVRLPRAEHSEPERVRMDFMTQLLL